MQVGIHKADCGILYSEKCRHLAGIIKPRQAYYGIESFSPRYKAKLEEIL